jgi:hypothetical protein
MQDGAISFGCFEIRLTFALKEMYAVCQSRGEAAAFTMSQLTVVFRQE